MIGFPEDRNSPELVRECVFKRERRTYACDSRIKSGAEIRSMKPFVTGYESPLRKEDADRNIGWVLANIEKLSSNGFEISGSTSEDLRKRLE